MARPFVLSLFLILSAGTLPGQVSPTRASVEIDAVGLFPVGGYKANEYTSGPGLRAGGEFRLSRNLAAEAGWTAAWMATDYDCFRFGCAHSRLTNRFLDYGLRGVLPLARGRVDLSLGVGGGYIWFDWASGDTGYYNGSLFQYSGKAAIALNRSGRWHLNLTARVYRDLGRPIQQWLATSAGISYRFGAVR